MNATAPAGVVLLTPPGRGAVATLLVEGPGAAELISALFRPFAGKCLTEYDSDRVLVGRWDGTGGEEVVVRRQCHDQIEVHCHGGSAAVDAIVGSLIKAGCRQLPWARWLRDRPADRLQVAARRALAEAQTQPAAAILLDQHAGALRRGLVEAEAAIADSDVKRASAMLRQMVYHARLGLHLVEPWRVVLAGPPNVGKSSLLNALLGYPRAIVCAQPGTTRDVVTATTAVGGWPVELADTAGLCPGGSAVEAAGVARTERQLQTADAVVLTFDASRPTTAKDRQLQNAWPSAIRVHNKCDLVRRRAAADGVLCVSALTGTGIDRLTAAIAAHLVPVPPAAGAPVPFRRRQIQAIHAALDALGQGDPTTARHRLRCLTRGSTRALADGK